MQINHNRVSRLFSLEGKVAAVTGPTRGIGKAIAMALAEAGADVALIQRSNEADVKNQICASGCKSEIFRCDMNDGARLKSVIPSIVEHFGQIDILVNNAGITRRASAVDYPEQDWDDILNVNLKAVWSLCQQAGRYMVPRSYGKIINLASLLTFQGGINASAYAAAKGGVGQLTKALSNEWARFNVNVNAIAPGYVATDMNEALLKDEQRNKQILERIPAGRWGNPEDFKGGVLYLASDASRYVHGHILTVDGGWMGR